MVRAHIHMQTVTQQETDKYRWNFQGLSGQMETNIKAHGKIVKGMDHLPLVFSRQRFKGDIYVGEYKFNVHNGQGTYIFKDGSK